MSNDIAASQAEMACGGEQARVVGMNFFETVFCCAGQVNGIGRAQMVDSGEDRVSSRETFNNDRARSSLSSEMATVLSVPPRPS
jgi:hypothetical protein